MLTPFSGRWRVRNLVAEPATPLSAVSPSFERKPQQCRTTSLQDRIQVGKSAVWRNATHFTSAADMRQIERFSARNRCLDREPRRCRSLGYCLTN
jgi:hypothetical protein